MSPARQITMRQFLEDERYLGSEDMLGGDTWYSWRVILIAAMGEPLARGERLEFKSLTGRAVEPGETVEELWAIVGRRGGKSRAIAGLAVYLSACIDYRGVLAPGQVGLIPVIAASKEQAAEVFNYACGMFADAPGLAGMLVGAPTANTIAVRSRVEIQVRAGSFRRSRGFTAVGAIGDEVAFWHSETTANPDKEVLNALRPSLGTTGGPLICISSPYAKKGELWNTYRRHYGADGHKKILVVKAPTLTLNPGFSERTIARAYEDDAASAACEYGAEFRGDIQGFLSTEVAEACVEDGVFERPFLWRDADNRKNEYKAFVDPSGGSRDSFTLAIAHQVNLGVGALNAPVRAQLDVVREVRPPFSPDDVAKQFADVCRAYGISKVKGDNYAAEWPKERFRAHGITYERSEKTRSELYLALLPLMNSRRVDLLDNERLKLQLIGLERRTARSGRDSVDHPPNGSDDVANAVAGAVVDCIGSGRTLTMMDVL